MLAYTASFGQGFSATVSIEDSMYRRYGTGDVWVDGAAGVNQVPLTRPLSGVYGLTYGPQKLPDIVANIRVDQAWGSAQVMGALHQLTDYGWSAAPASAISAGGMNFGSPVAAAKFFQQMAQVAFKQLRDSSDLVAEVTRWGLEATGLDIEHK